MYRIIDQGLKDNRIAYDNIASVGVFTRKLLFHMIQNAPEIQVVYVPPHCYVEFLPDDWNVNDKSVELFGIIIIFEPRLEPGYSQDDEFVIRGEYMKYYQDKNARLAPEDEYLLIGTRFFNEDDDIELTEKNVILASC